MSELMGAFLTMQKEIFELKTDNQRLRADCQMLFHERDAYRQESEAREGMIEHLKGMIEHLKYELEQEQLRSASMKFKIIELEHQLKDVPVRVQCTECGDPACPGVVRCPKCGYSDHGAEAFTHIQDHGYCQECLRQWQFGETEVEE